jgi:hypothetical protein
MVWKKCRTRIAIYDRQVKAWCKGLASLCSALFPLAVIISTLFFGYYFCYSTFLISSYELTFDQWSDHEAQVLLEAEVEKAFAEGLYFWQVPSFSAQLKVEHRAIDAIKFSIDQDRKCHCTFLGPQFLCQVNDAFLLSKKGLLFEKKRVKDLVLTDFPSIKVASALQEKEYAALVAPLSFFTQYKEWNVEVKSLSEIFLTSSCGKKNYRFLYDCNVTNSTFLSVPADINTLLKAKNISLKKGEQWVFDMRFGSYIVVGKTKKGGEVL